MTSDTLNDVESYFRCGVLTFRYKNEKGEIMCDEGTTDDFLIEEVFEGRKKNIKTRKGDILTYFEVKTKTYKSVNYWDIIELIDFDSVHIYD